MNKEFKAKCLAEAIFGIATALACSGNAMALTSNDAREKLSLYRADGFEAPVNENTSNRGYTFADYWKPLATSTATLHTGVDLNTLNDCGAIVKSAANGIVREKLHGGGTWGGVILIQHRTSNANGDADFTTQYAHIAPSDKVNIGDYVYRGQSIGYIARGTDAQTRYCTDMPDSSGYSTYDVPWSAHLHYELRNNATLGATNWPTAASINATTRNTNCARYTSLVSSTVPSECRISAINQLGYVNPTTSFGWNNDETASAAILDLSTKLIISSDDGSVEKDNNTTITKRQAALIFARALNYKRTGAVFEAQTQLEKDRLALAYAVNNEIISQSSTEQPDFNEKVKREIFFIMAARFIASSKNESFSNFSSCTTDPFNDVSIDSSYCKYLNYAKSSNLFSGHAIGGKTYAYPSMYLTRDAISEFIKKVIDVNPNESTSFSTGHYQDNQDTSKILAIPGATSLTVTVNGDTEKEYDYIYIYDQYDRLVKTLTGTINHTFTVAGSSIKVRLKTDGSVTSSGVTVTISSSNSNPSVPTDRSKADGIMSCLERLFSDAFPNSPSTQEWPQYDGTISYVRIYSNGLGQGVNSGMWLFRNGSWGSYLTINDIKTHYCPTAW